MRKVNDHTVMQTVLLMLLTGCVSLISSPCSANEKADYLYLGELLRTLDALQQTESATGPDSISPAATATSAGNATSESPAESADPTADTAIATSPLADVTFWIGPPNPSELGDTQQPATNSPSPGQVVAEQSATTLPANSPRVLAITWLDKFAKEQTLLAKQDVKSMRQAILTMPQAELTDWLHATAPLRKAMDTDEWQQTNRWLAEFWKVQAIYTDQQIANFHQRMRTLTPRETLLVMDHFANEYLTRVHRRDVNARRTRALSNLPARIISTRPTSGVSQPATRTATNLSQRNRRERYQNVTSDRIKDWFVFRGYYRYY